MPFSTPEEARRSIRGLVLALAANLIPAAWAPAADAPAQLANIAAGKTYSFTWPPDYKYCTTGTEWTKLTDGVYTKGYFWTQPTTVGWTEPQPVTITIDLGEVQPICGVSFNTAAGLGGVRWPVSIDVLISDDASHYYYFGELGDLDAARSGETRPTETAYSVHRFWTQSLAAHGRYVAFAVQPFTSTFVDEIEVYRGKNDLLTAAMPGQAYATPETFLKQTAVQRGIARRVARDAVLLDPQFRPPSTQYRSEDAWANEAVPVPKDFRAILPLSDEHRKVYRAAAAQMRAAGLDAPLAQAWNIWEPMPHLALPPKSTVTNIDVAMMQNEYRAGSFAVTNPSDSDLELAVHIQGLPGGTRPPYVSAAEVQFTDTKVSEVAASALPAAQDGDGGWMVHVPAGMTRQVWLTFHPTNAPPGDYPGKVTIQGAGGVSLEVPLHVRLAPLRMADSPALGLGGWDYTNATQAVTNANRGALIAHLREHYVDSPWATNQVLPTGKIDPVFGTMANPPDTQAFDMWVRSWPGAKHYCLFAGTGDSFAGFHYSRPQFAIAVGQWARFWADHARRLGIAPGNIYTLLVDEPSKPAMDASTIAWEKAIRGSGAGFQVWEDPTHIDPYTADPQLFELANILCPNRQTLLYNRDYRRFFDEVRDPPWRTEMYSAMGPARSLDPYAYYRLQAWDCWKRGARAEYFWAFTDTQGASSWDEYLAADPPFSPLFIDDASVTAAKEMEAIREGIEDYQYLLMLRDRIAQLESQNDQREQLPRARRLLQTATDNVLPGFGISEMYRYTPRDRSTADRVRLQVLDMLLSLQ